MSTLSMLGLPFLACLLLTGILSYLGLHVLKREVVFIDIAVAQVAALGAIVAHMFFHVHGDSPQALACAVGATLIAALFFALARRCVSQLPIEATIGITYAIVAGGTLFLIGQSTCGHTHVQEMLTGGLLWVDWRSLGWTALLFALVGAAFAVCRGPLQELSDNYHGAATKGRPVAAWDFVFYALCGLVITFGVRLAGVLVVFCYLIIPATASAFLATSWLGRLAIAWLVGTAASVTGLAFSQAFDFSAGVAVSFFLGVALAVCTLIRKCTGGKHVDRGREMNRAIAQYIQISAVVIAGAIALTSTAQEFYVETWDGVTVVLPYRGSDTVGEVKSLLQSCREIPSDQQQLSLRGKTLSDEDMLAEAAVVAGDELALMFESPRFTDMDVASTGITLRVDCLLGGITHRLQIATSLYPVTEWCTGESRLTDWGETAFTLPSTNAPCLFYRIRGQYTNGTWLSM